ncbi:MULTISPECIES: hypothetical protein [Xanthomonas]|uniref:Uncharacterized protein n=1 Tax=Xanthomonas cucurbitae TaxID=56453 RepID=A0ABY7YCV7_9XANT|nr:hypothetical protein [Xanthomonas cucurbitae]WDM67710.1 hypothetical protein K6981_20135 [Xanthomonas cucurbitae]WDM71586.1 hypothetical protein K6978_20100 [Xanthomonas cucurbitae]WDM75430.1 hypothetical protein K6982_19230 [Xanthomonas cucurbitae]WDM79139.1 hypothetical protein K6980_18900 [Xanthomonas cucurbitae]WDM82823.1 hypothetical protein K6979_18895 [Xanthomonas cucurbitae]
MNDALGKDGAENVRAVHVPFGDKAPFMHARGDGKVGQQPVEQSLMQAKAIKQDQGQTQ